MCAGYAQAVPGQPLRPFLLPVFATGQVAAAAVSHKLTEAETASLQELRSLLTWLLLQLGIINHAQVELLLESCPNPQNPHVCGRQRCCGSCARC